MIRALTILAAVVALAVAATPASAGSSERPPPRTTQVVVLIGANDYGLVAARAVSASPASAGSKSPPRADGNVENIDPFVGMVKAKVGGAAKVIDHEGAFLGIFGGH